MPSDRLLEEILNLCGKFRQHYAEESDNDVEKTPDYAEISKII